MSALSWLFGKKPIVTPPDDTELKKEMSEAVDKQLANAHELRMAQLRAMSDSEHIQEALRGVLYNIQTRNEEKDDPGND